MPRAAAALVAMVCWAGLVLQFAATNGVQHDAIASLWVIGRFFTILTNLALAVIITLVAAGRRVSPFLLGEVTLAILLVGIVYTTLLAGLHPLHGLAIVADFLLHKVSPVAMTAWWLAFAPRRQLRWSAPLGWSAYPVAYFGYALARGAFDGKYPYPFIDVGQIGWSQTLINAAAIAVAFALGGLVLVALDRTLPGRAKAPR